MPELPSFLVEWFKQFPILGALFACIYGLLWLLKEPLKKGAMALVDYVIDRIKLRFRTHKTLLTPEEHAAQAERLIALSQYAQHACDALSCTHVSVYGNMNGESLKNQESIEKLLMVTEAVARADQSATRWMQKQRVIYTADMPNLMRDIYRNPYAIIHAKDHPDPFVVRTMRGRNYESALAIQITSMQNNGIKLALGVIIFAWQGLDIQVEKDGRNAYLTPRILEYLEEFKLEFSDRMDNKIIQLNLARESVDLATTK